LTGTVAAYVYGFITRAALILMSVLRSIGPIPPLILMMVSESVKYVIQVPIVMSVNEIAFLKLPS